MVCSEKPPGVMAGFIVSANFKMLYFPEGLGWWLKRRVFETGKGLSIDNIGTFFDSLSLIGVLDGI